MTLVKFIRVDFEKFDNTLTILSEQFEAEVSKKYVVTQDICPFTWKEAAEGEDCSDL